MLLVALCFGSPDAGAQQSADDDASCDPKGAGLAVGAPLELQALFDIDCARSLVTVRGETGAALASDLGYPTLLLEMRPHDEAIAFLQAVAEQGDRGFFAFDPLIAERLREGGAPENLQAFVASATPRSEGAETTPDMIDVFSNSAANDDLIALCQSADCDGEPTICPGLLALSDKLALAEGRVSLRETLRLCPPSFEWILALRRAGVVDTSCSSTLQVNLAMANIDKLQVPCFDQGTALADLPARTSSDAIRLLRQRLVAGVPIAAEDLQIVSSVLPEAARYLENLQGAEE
ncbi:hypothetical protein ACG74X_20445 [Marivita sp. S0852]|uniref:hypothetical protein n=1 Tax=Marivita sp. S0852 TaxID=3373893 RepID=UPI003981F49B